jgi:hypothetical protein
MEQNSPSRDYMGFIYGGLLLIVGAAIEFFEGQSDRRLLYLGAFALLVGCYRGVIAHYNSKRPPSAHIHPWLSNLCLAGAIALAGLIDYATGGHSYALVFVLSAVAASVAALCYLKKGAKSD